jgi:hypothetical protein
MLALGVQRLVCVIFCDRFRRCDGFVGCSRWMGRVLLGLGKGHAFLCRGSRSCQSRGACSEVIEY